MAKVCTKQTTIKNKAACILFSLLIVCILLDPEDGGCTFLWNARKLLPVYMASHPRRQYSSYLYLLFSFSPLLQHDEPAPPCDLVPWIYSECMDEVLTAMVTKSPIFWDVTPCSPLKVNRHFRGICCLHVLGWRISQAKKPALYPRR
jgi:hypothetical protein